MAWKEINADLFILTKNIIEKVTRMHFEVHAFSSYTSLDCLIRIICCVSNQNCVLLCGYFYTSYCIVLLLLYSVASVCCVITSICLIVLCCYYCIVLLLYVV
jgi:hypothetical protein